MAPAVPLSRVRTRVGFGVSLVGGGARVLGSLSSINFNQPSEAKPIAQARLSGLLWLPGTTAAGSDGPCGLKAPS